MPSGLENIAKAANVATSTVSRALTGKAGVSAEKREEILKLADEMGYQPNLQARRLRSGKTMGLALITYVSQTEIAQKRQNFIYNLAQKMFGETHLFVLNKDEDLNIVIQRIISERYSAIILNGISADVKTSSLKTLASKKIPLVSIDEEIEGADNVLIDRSTGTYQAARMLLLSGCRNPVFFLSESYLKDPYEPRFAGIKKAYESLGLDPASINVLPVRSSDYKSGFDLADKVLKTMHCDGIFAYNDNMAGGAMRALTKAGIKVPEEIKIIGFDDIPVSAFLPVSLTTAAQPIENVTEKALELAYQKMRNFNTAAQTVSFPTKLIVRESAPLEDYSLREKIFELPK